MECPSLLAVLVEEGRDYRSDLIVSCSSSIMKLGARARKMGESFRYTLVTVGAYIRVGFADSTEI
jgi:hypothetical protein